MVVASSRKSLDEWRRHTEPFETEVSGINPFGPRNLLLTSALGKVCHEVAVPNRVFYLA
jgi:hypothetical protein